jgi:hypothetical protein
MITRAHDEPRHARDTLKIFADNQRLCPIVDNRSDIQRVSSQYDEVISGGQSNCGSE